MYRGGINSHAQTCYSYRSGRSLRKHIMRAHQWWSFLTLTLIPTSTKLLLCAGGPWERAELNAVRELVCLCRICLRLLTGTVTGLHAFSFLLPQPWRPLRQILFSPFSLASILFPTWSVALAGLSWRTTWWPTPFIPCILRGAGSSWTYASPSLGRSGSLY